MAIDRAAMMKGMPMTKQAMMVGKGMDEEGVEEEGEMVDCPTCGGTGVDIEQGNDKIRTIKCATCGGTGKVPAGYEDGGSEEMGGEKAPA